MTYPYHCPKCGWLGTVTKPVADSSRRERCESATCKGKMRTLVRVFESSGIRTSDGFKK